MDCINLESKNKKELQEICSDLKLKNYQKLKKADLINLINEKKKSPIDNEDDDEEGETIVIELETKENTFDIKNEDGLEYLGKIDDNSIDLILTDPPYIISKDSGMDNH